MADQLQDLVATAEAMIASQGVPRTPANIQRAVQMLAANPDLPRTQVARRTGLTRAPDELYLGDGLDAAPAEAVGASAPSNPPASQAAPGAAPSSSPAAQTQPQQTQAPQQTDPNDVVDGDEFEPVDPNGMPLLPLVAPAAAAGMRGGQDAMGMDIEGQGRSMLPGPEDVLALPGPGGSTLPQPPINPQLLPPEPTVINMPNEASGPTITPQPSFEQSMDARGTNVIDASPQLQIVKSKRTGNLYQVNKVTGEVLDNAGRPLNSSAAQALLRTIRRL